MKNNNIKNIIEFQPSLVLIGGLSGIGKTTIVNKLISNWNDFYIRPISYTSRKRRNKESDEEYIFVSKSDIYKMKDDGDILSIDNVYDNLYAISKKSIYEILKKDKIPIKEVHPKNHLKLKKYFNNLVSIYIKSDLSGINKHIRKGRKEDDYVFYSKLNPLKFDIIIRTSPTQPINEIAQNLHYSIYSFISTQNYFPRPQIIDQINTKGYTKIAPEFIDEKRITTKNFHDLSYSYFVKAIDRFIKPQINCLEIGPGQGWLETMLPMKNIKYTGIDISSKMIKQSKLNNEYIYQSSARFIDFPDKYFDIIFASLCDPYFYPTALCEIRRVLKPHGFFIFSIPSSKWSDGIRSIKKRLRTIFKLENGTYAEVFSFTFSIHEIKQLISLCGFSLFDYEIASGNCLGSVNISPAIIKSASNQKLDLSDLPILNLITAEKI